MHGSHTNIYYSIIEFTLRNLFALTLFDHSHICRATIRNSQLQNRGLSPRYEEDFQSGRAYGIVTRISRTSSIPENFLKPRNTMKLSLYENEKRQKQSVNQQACYTCVENLENILKYSKVDQLRQFLHGVYVTYHDNKNFRNLVYILC